MAQSIALVSIVVPDYDEAVSYYTSTLGFDLIEDSARERGKRWVVVAPRGGHGASLLLARAATDDQQRAIGNQTGGRVFLFLHTDDFWRDHRVLLSRGVKFTEEPRHESYGTVVVFEDLYGNRWDLVQRKPDIGGTSGVGVA
jgi:catechol 2,3-dioxygenase-like lactoylglutathione lyase family enzyme